MNIGIGIQATTALCGFYVFSQCTLPVQTVQSSGSWNGHDFAATAEFTIIFVIQTVSVLASLLSLYKFSKHLTIEPAGHNHFTTVYKVLKYAWINTSVLRDAVPQLFLDTSQTRHWEEDMDTPRIDLGKNKYAKDPFTTEDEKQSKKRFSVLHLLSSEWSSILVLAQVNTRWNILLPVGEGTASLRTLVLPGILEHLVDSGEVIVTSWLNSEVLRELVQRKQ